MDILNFISWIKAGNYRDTLPTDVPNLLAIGAKDPSRDDGWLPLAVNAAPLQSLYDKGKVTQLTSINTGVTLNTHVGVITTFVATTAAGAQDIFTFSNSNISATSVILVTASYSGTGNAIVTTFPVQSGGVRIIISNDDAAAALNAVVLVNFMIIN
jgi:hypothetical protein